MRKMVIGCTLHGNFVFALNRYTYRKINSKYMMQAESAVLRNISIYRKQYIIDIHYKNEIYHN